MLWCVSFRDLRYDGVKVVDEVNTEEKVRPNVESFIAIRKEDCLQTCSDIHAWLSVSAGYVWIVEVCGHHFSAHTYHFVLPKHLLPLVLIYFMSKNTLFTEVYSNKHTESIHIIGILRTLRPLGHLILEFLILTHDFIITNWLGVSNF